MLRLPHISLCEELRRTAGESGSVGGVSVWVCDGKKASVFGIWLARLKTRWLHRGRLGVCGLCWVLESLCSVYVCVCVSVCVCLRVCVRVCVCV